MTSIAYISQSFGAFLLYKWHTDDTTAKNPVPGYIIAILVLACLIGLSNTGAYLGVCLNSRCLLSVSASLSLAIILAQGVFAAILIVDPSLLASCMCPDGDTKCVEAIVGSFKNAFTTLLLSIIWAFEIVALCSIRCLSQRTPEDSELDKVITDRGSLSQSLLHDDWEARRDEFEARSKRRLEQQRAALSSVAKKGLQVHVLVFCPRTFVDCTH